MGMYSKRVLLAAAAGAYHLQLAAGVNAAVLTGAAASCRPDRLPLPPPTVAGYRL